MEWKKVNISDIGRVVTGKTPRTAIEGNYGGNIPFLTPSDDLSEKHISATKKTLTEMGLNEVKKCLIPVSSICVTCIGSDLGKVIMNEKPLVTNQQINSIIPNEETDADYIYYLMTIVGKELNHLSKTSTAVPIINKSTFEKFPLSLPPLPTQRRIAAILSSLDAQIENNNRINRNLEAQAQALFKSWFVDFEPWGGKMPEGWKEVSLTNIADYLNGLAMQKFPAINGEESLPVLKIKELGAKCIDESSDRCTSKIKSDYIIENGDVIFSWSGTLLVDIWTGGKAGLNQHLFKVTSNKYPKWFYLMWTKNHLEDFINIAKDKAVTMGHIKRGHLEAAICNVPDKDVMKKANALFEPLVEQMINVRIQSARLASLRDTLLPKLMKGEIEV